MLIMNVCKYTILKMKIKILMLYCGLAISIICSAGNVYPGIFSTVEDYKENRISIVADTTQHKILKIDDFFFRPYIWIKTSSGKQRILRRNVFAVRMPDKKVYRIINDGSYQVLDTSNICIYAKDKEISIPKWTVHSTRYEHKKVTEYFFSTSISDSILKLCLTNLRLALLKDKHFDNILTTHFQSDKLLLTKNKNGQFEINVFLNSIKK
jgi:hypothetical protein